MSNPRICIDANCPNCGWPERWADVKGEFLDPTDVTFGCNKCDYVSKERNA